jgi:FKBP-type peptidyl-prolyl cis-trans isomerase FklB
MKKVFNLSLIALILVPNLFFAQENSKDLDSLSYSLGILIASNLKDQGFDVLDSESFTKALKDVLQEEDFLIELEEANQLVSQYLQSKTIKANEIAQQREMDFFEENASRKGVITTDSGLQYEIIETGQGNTPGQEDKVTVHYTGTLLDGRKFDSSRDRGQPATFPVNGVIPGWTEVLQLMKEGDRWRVFIPFQLAYGERGAGDVIPPFATLVFDVELISVN